MLLVSTSAWTSVQNAALDTLKDLAVSRAISSDAPDAPVLVACLCGVLLSELSPAMMDRTCSLLATLSEQGEWMMLSTQLL